MPIYEYHCNKCNKDFECLVFGNEQPECPMCKNKNVKKLMSASTFFSKGGDGLTTKAAAGTSACSGCAATSCTSCDH